MRGAALPLLLLLPLVACGGGLSELGIRQPGIDVAQAALRGGAPQVALQVADGLLSKDSANEPALLVQGDALTALGHLDDAAASYAKVLKRDPGSVGAHIGLGRIRLATDPAGAEALFLEALQGDPRNTAALNDLGIARDLLGNHAAAQQAYSQALGIDPELRAAQVNLALSLAMTGDADRAERMLQPLATSPGASRKLRHDLAAVLAMGDKREEAERILSTDLSPAEVRQAMTDFAAARAGGRPVPLLAGTASGAVAPVAPAAGHVQVQFAAVPSEEAAHAEWQRLQERMPGLLAGREPLFVKIERDGAAFWRVRTNGFASVAEATAFCAKVRAVGGACMVSETEGAAPAGGR